MIRRYYFLMVVFFFAGTSLWAVAEPTAEELEQQRRRLDALRKQPEKLARLRENLNAYLALPEKRQTAIAKLDHDLREAKEKHWWTVLERYADWLDELRQTDPVAYQAIKDAPSAAVRLALVKDQRDRAWMAEQPKSLRDQWEALKREARAEFATKARKDERGRHAQWVIAKRFWKELESRQPMPSKLSDFADAKPDKVKKYVEDYLMPYLTEAEKKRLTTAEGRWPDYPIALVQIASKRPSALPPDPPRFYAKLPFPVQHRLVETKKGDKIGVSKKLMIEIKQHEAANFASKVVAIGLRENKLPFGFEYLAPNRKSLLPPMQEFVDTKLDAALDQAEKRMLTDSMGKWPEYPKAIQQLAQKYQLTPPWHYLPEPERWKWDLYRDVKARSWGAEIAKDKK